MIERVQALLARHKLTLAVALAIAVALVMTSISMTLYVTSGTSSLDLSRPGFQELRDEVVREEPAEDFSPAGTLDAAAAEEFQRIFDAQRNELKQLGDFEDESLTDQSLRLE